MYLLIPLWLVTIFGRAETNYFHGFAPLFSHNITIFLTVNRQILNRPPELRNLQVNTFACFVFQELSNKFTCQCNHSESAAFPDVVMDLLENWSTDNITATSTIPEIAERLNNVSRATSRIPDMTSPSKSSQRITSAKTEPTDASSARSSTTTSNVTIAAKQTTLAMTSGVKSTYGKYVITTVSPRLSPDGTPYSGQMESDISGWLLWTTTYKQTELVGLLRN